MFAKIIAVFNSEIVFGIVTGVITSILATALISLAKGMLYAHRFIKNCTNNSFTVEGLWQAKTEGNDNNGDPLVAYELVDIFLKGKILNARIYQAVYKGDENIRFHCYNGMGYYRNGSLVLAYEENEKSSNFIGTYNLSVTHLYNHITTYEGKYNEICKEKWVSRKYTLVRLNLPKFEVFRFRHSSQKYKQWFMRRPEFQNECKKALH